MAKKELVRSWIEPGLAFVARNLVDGRVEQGARDFYLLYGKFHVGGDRSWPLLKVEVVSDEEVVLHAGYGTQALLFAQDRLLHWAAIELGREVRVRIAGRVIKSRGRPK
ncbi:MAG: hypothetical protein V1856_01535 [Candidatus Liptonbacteria bacterium]